MSHWREIAEDRQHKALAALPADATLKEKSNAIRDAWPAWQLGERGRWPYKMWLIVRREMLGLPRIKTGEARKRELRHRKALKESGLKQGKLL